MATYAIKWLKDKLGTRFFPITHLKAVRDDNNTNLESILSDKQDELVSGVNIKTINGNSILGSGNMDVSGGGGGGQANVIESISVNGTGQAVDANKNVNLQFKTVNNNNISGIGNIDIAVPTKVSDLTNDAGYITGYTETDPVFSASVAAEITSSDITNWNGKTSNIGTITSVKMNGTTVSSSGEADLGTVITSHQDISGKADKSATVSTVTYNTTSKKITKTINGTTTDVVTAAKIVTDGGGITSETDPTVPSWAKASSKPSYTASEVGAVPTTRTVNGKALSADITLSASDVSALPSSTAIPSKTSDLTNDSGYLTSADISGVYKYKGSKTNYSQLPSTGNVTGDVWNVVNAYSTYPAGTNFAWDGTTWDAIGGSVDLSGYVPTSRTVNGKALSSNISLSASDVSALPSSTYIPTKTSDLTNDSDFITSADIPEGAAASTTTPKMDGTAAVGTETRFARGDHRHPTDTSRQAAITSSSKLSADLIEDGTTNKTVTATEKSTWNSKGTYSKPSGGIPKTDLASAVQTSLGLADTALQSYTESDPVFTASAAHGISSTDISNWNAKGTYSKPSGGIPKTDLASAVQTSLGKADTALQSYTETDPVFTASVAADITSSDISNWNSKTSNIGTITGINMNGASKGTSGVVDLGTVITAHQDISGKADVSDLDNYLPLSGGTMSGTIKLPAGTGIEYSTGAGLLAYHPTSWGGTTNTQWCVGSLDSQGVIRSSNANLLHYNDGDGQSYAILDAKNYSSYALPLTGGTLTGDVVTTGEIMLYNNKYIRAKNTNDDNVNILGIDDNNHVLVGYGNTAAATYIYGNSIRLLYGTSRTIGLTLNSSGNVTVAGYVAVGTGGANGNSYVASDSANNIYLKNSSGAVLVCDGKVIRRSTSLSDVTLGSSSYPWGGIYSTSGNFSDHIYLANNKYLYIADSGGTNRNVLYCSTGNNLFIGYDIAVAGKSTYIDGNSIYFRYGTAHGTAAYINTSGNVGIGTTSPSTKLHVSGVVKCTSVDTSSDETLKDKVGDISINVKDIAAAPNVTFRWKEGEDTKSIHGGTYAQYWEKITPYYVHGEEGDKSLDYASLAVSCSIELAKEIVQLKEENAQLKKELVELKEMVNKLIK